MQRTVQRWTNLRQVAPRPSNGLTTASYTKYLRDRYAHMVVLTFGQIEDLLGAPLPEAARVASTWWTEAGPDGAPSSMSDTWIQAKRTAVPNLPAHTVLFERMSA